MMEEIARDLTALGGIAALCLVTAAVSGYLLISHKFRRVGCCCPPRWAACS